MCTIHMVWNLKVKNLDRGIKSVPWDIARIKEYLKFFPYQILFITAVYPQNQLDPTGIGLMIKFSKLKLSMHWHFYQITYDSSQKIKLVRVPYLSKIIQNAIRVQKKRNTFDLEYLKDGSIKSVVLLVRYLVLPYNSIESNYSFLWWLET